MKDTAYQPINEEFCRSIYAVILMGYALRLDPLVPFRCHAQMNKMIAALLLVLPVFGFAEIDKGHFFSMESDLTAMCNLFGYSKAVTATAFPPNKTKFESFDWVMTMVLDAKGHTSEVVRNFAPSLATLPEEIVSVLTCQP